MQALQNLPKHTASAAPSTAVQGQGYLTFARPVQGCRARPALHLRSHVFSKPFCAAMPPQALSHGFAAPLDDPGKDPGQEVSQGWEETLTLSLEDGNTLEVHKFPLGYSSPVFASIFEHVPDFEIAEVDGSGQVWQDILVRLYPATTSSAASKALKTDQALAIIPVATKYSILCVLEDCAQYARRYAYSMDEKSSTDAIKWIQLSKMYKEEHGLLGLDFSDGAIAFMASVAASNNVASFLLMKNGGSPCNYSGYNNDFDSRVNKLIEKIDAIDGMLYSFLKKMWAE